MILKTMIAKKNYQFDSIRTLLAKANEKKSGDDLAGISAESESERVAAKIILADVLVSDIRNNPVIPYEEDEITRMIQDRVCEKTYSTIKNLSIGELREKLLGCKNSEEIEKISKGLTAEVIAAVTKIMTNLDLVYGAKKIEVTATCNTTIGKPKVLASRLQPNHTTDNLDGIMAALYEGLSYGVGDALIGLNPVSDAVDSVAQILNRFEEVKEKWEIPTQICVLAHITTQIEAMKKGAPTDLIFQSIAGSEKGNNTFGFTTKTIKEAMWLLKERGVPENKNVMYFETGQGSELSSNTHYGADQVTMEARCYGYAKEFNPFIVNTVVGFIGPEFLYDSKQVIRAGLEDHFMGKLTGVPMGCDCCYTNHMLADQNDIENLTMLLASAGCTYIVGVPTSDDIMLNYQSNSFHDIATVREILGLRPIEKFEKWLEKMEIMENGKLTDRAGDLTIFAGGMK